MSHVSQMNEEGCIVLLGKISLELVSSSMIVSIAVLCCSVLQCVAMCCSVLQ